MTMTLEHPISFEVPTPSEDTPPFLSHPLYQARIFSENINLQLKQRLHCAALQRLNDMASRRVKTKLAPLFDDDSNSRNPFLKESDEVRPEDRQDFLWRKREDLATCRIKHVVLQSIDEEEEASILENEHAAHENEEETAEQEASILENEHEVQPMEDLPSPALPPTPAPSPLTPPPSPDLPSDPEKWTATQVSVWLRSNGIPEGDVERLYAAVVDGELFRMIDESYLISGGMRPALAFMLIQKRDILFFDECDLPNASTIDEHDGKITAILMESVEIAVIHLLRLAFGKFIKDTCYGCEVNHPSQRQHSCLDPFDEDYYVYNYKKVVKVLRAGNYIQAVQRFLRLRGLMANDLEVKFRIEIILQVVSREPDIYGCIDRSYTKHMMGNEKVLRHLDMVTHGWKI